MQTRSSGRRSCERCQRDVHDLSPLREHQAHRRLAEGTCIRYTADRRGRPLYADSLVAAPILAGILLAGCASTRIVDSQPITVAGEVPAPRVTMSPAVPQPAVAPAECDPPDDRVVVKVMGMVQTVRNIPFAKGETAIPAAATALLDEIAQILEQYPHIERIRVSGHTDNRGSTASKRRISQRRAEAVVEYLVGKGIDASRLVPVGEADAFPIDTNHTPKGRANNRRVEFEIER